MSEFLVPDNPAVVLQAGLQPAGEAQRALFDSLLWFGAVVIALLLAVVIVLGLRRRLLDTRRETDAGLDLADLRRQRDQGLLSAEEYDALRKAVVQAASDPPSSDRG